MEEYTENCNASQEAFVFNDILTNIAGSSAALLSFLGLLFNFVTVCALLLHSPIRHHVTTPFVISLAMSDLLFSAAILPLLAIKFFSKYDFIYGKNN